MRQDASTISWAQEGEEWIRLAQTSDQRLYFVMPYMLDKLQDVAGIGRRGTGLDRQVVVKNYFESRVWDAPLYKGEIPVRWHHRTIEEYARAFLGAGLCIVDLEEPRPTEEQAAAHPNLAWLRKIPLYLFWELCKPEAV